MQVNINHEKSIDGFAERIISMDLEEYNEITLALNLRLKHLEEKLEEYKESADAENDHVISFTNDLLLL